MHAFAPRELYSLDFKPRKKTTFLWFSILKLERISHYQSTPKPAKPLASIYLTKALASKRVPLLMIEWYSDKRKRNGDVCFQVEESSHNDEMPVRLGSHVTTFEPFVVVVCFHSIFTPEMTMLKRVMFLQWIFCHRDCAKTASFLLLRKLACMRNQCKGTNMSQQTLVKLKID